MDSVRCGAPQSTLRRVVAGCHNPSRERCSAHSAAAAAVTHPGRRSPASRRRRLPLRAGCLVTVGALCTGLAGFIQGDQKLMQRMMRMRVVAQGATVRIRLNPALVVPLLTPRPHGRCWRWWWAWLHRRFTLPADRKEVQDCTIRLAFPAGGEPAIGRQGERKALRQVGATLKGFSCSLRGPESERGVRWRGEESVPARAASLVKRGATIHKSKL